MAADKWYKNFMALVIRPYRERDLHQTARLWAESWRSTGLDVALTASAAELYADNLQRIPREIGAGWDVFLAFDDDRPVGFIAMKRPARQLDQLFVSPEAQGRGIGRMLIDFAKRQLPDGFWLRTAANNRRACAFYEREGCRRGETGRHLTLGHQTVIYHWP